MEVELKYTVDSRKTADRIWNDPQLKELEEDDSRSSNDFRGTYYDTEDYDLFRHDIAYRLRTEGNKLVASLKWNGKNTGPLHKREELNITLGDARQPKDPDPSVFCESEEGGELLELVAGTLPADTRARQQIRPRAEAAGRALDRNAAMPPRTHPYDYRQEE